MMISGVSLPQQGSWSANDSVDGATGFEGQKNIPRCSNVTCHKTARGLCSRDIAGHDGTVSAGNRVKSLKRPCSTPPDLDVTPQKITKKELSTVSESSTRHHVDAELKFRPANPADSLESDVFRICFQRQMERVVSKARLKFLLATKEQIDRLENKKKEITCVEEKLRDGENSLRNPMHPMTCGIKQMLLDQYLRKLVALQLEVKKLTRSLAQDERKKEFNKIACELATREVASYEVLDFGVRPVVEDYMNNPRLAECLAECLAEAEMLFRDGLKQ